MQKSRIHHLDVARGIGIILVVLGHLNLPKYMINVIYLFHMPLFMYLSGSVSGAYSGKRQIKLISSFLIYGTILCLISAMVDEGGLMGRVACLFSLRPVSLWNGAPYAGPMWFLLALFTVKLISNFLHLGLLVCAVIFLSIGWFSPAAHYLSDIPFGIGQAFMLLLFFELGREGLSHHIPSNQSAAIAASFFVGVVLTQMVFFSGLDEKLVNFHQLEMFDPLLAVLGSISGIIVTLWVSAKISCVKKIAKILSWIGKYSFGMYVWHLFVFGATVKVIRAVSTITNPIALMVFQLSALIVFVIFYAKIVKIFLSRYKSSIYV